MAVKQFAIPLDDTSLQSGDINFKELANNNNPVTFQLSNVSSGSTNELDLITNKSGMQISHKFSATVSSGNASVTLTAAQVTAVFKDADGMNRDYVDAYWTVGQVDTPSKSNSVEIQSGQTYDTHGWPPKIL